MKNVSAPLFAHPVPTKTKLDSPRANHVQAIRTALPVPPVAHSMPPVVQTVPTPVVQRPFVIRVVLESTTIKQVNRLNQLLVNVAMWENIKTKREKHRVIYVVLESTMLNKDNQVVIHAVLGNTMIKPVKLLVKDARWENTKTKREKHPATMIV